MLTPADGRTRGGHYQSFKPIYHDGTKVFFVQNQIGTTFFSAPIIRLILQSVRRTQWRNEFNAHQLQIDDKVQEIIQTSNECNVVVSMEMYCCLSYLYAGQYDWIFRL